jgi:uncharacterized phiE125 gp8 family phage protein
MYVVVITPPDFAVVSLDEAKAQLRVDHDDDNDLIETLIEVATQHIDGSAGWLGRALISQTLELQLDRFPNCGVLLPYPPVAGPVTSVKYDDADGVEQTANSSSYRLVGPSGRPRFELEYGATWPSTRCQTAAVRIRYVAGYGESGDDVPAPIRHAILLMVSELYQNREITGDTGRDLARELPFAVTALLSPYRVF